MSNQKEFPFEIKELEGELATKYPNVRNDYVFVGPKRYCWVKNYKNHAEAIYNFQVRPDDVWIFGYPRSGTTVAQEMVWLIANDLDYKKAAEEVMDVRFPVLENALAMNEKIDKVCQNSSEYKKESVEVALKLAKPAWEKLAEKTERRFIKTHLPFSLAPPEVLTSGCKVFYLMRNPKDVCVSQYNLRKHFTIFDAPSFEQYWDLFRQNLGFFTPYFEHIKEAWAVKDNKNVMILNYDIYIKDIRKTLISIAEFLGKNLDDSQLDVLENHLKIDNFRKNKSVNNDHLRDLGIMKDEDDKFIRKGKIGGWREYFKEPMNEEADKWIEENLRDTNIKFA